ncbi:MAG: beta-galactosidase, partial [Spirochaetota bacterium]
LQGSIATTTSIFRDFPDVFSDEFALASERHAEQLSRFAGDKRLLGYFIMNEPHWAFEDSLNVAEKLLANPAELASKEALLSFLSERYAGDARRLATAWNLPELASFDELRTPRSNAASLSEAAAADLDAFNTVLIKRFAQLPCEAAKRADPDHLNLGMRYAWISQPALYETGEYFDVFSINRYAPTAREEVDKIGERSGKPVMIGEFHHGALDAGLPSNGIRGVRTQAQRAEAYRYFVETTAASPWSVGVHYFTLNDQAILGRFDGENFQIGLVDICQRPYDDFVTGVTETNRGLPEVLYGERAATDYYPPEVTVGF